MTTAGVTRAIHEKVELIDDVFLSQQLRRRVVRLPIGDCEALPAVADLVRGLETPAMVHARVPAHCVATVQALEDAGFRLSDTCLTFERGRMTGEGSGSPAVVRPARPGDEAGVVALARRALRMSRFHRDPAIGVDVADALKGQWAANYFCGLRGDAMTVAEGPSGEIAGFLLALRAADGAMVIDLVAVNEASRGRGLAASLTRAAQGLFPRARRLRVGTQAVNGAARRAYEKLGFEPAGTDHVLHFHV